jgi:hypothetical protein
VASVYIVVHFDNLTPTDFKFLRCTYIFDASALYKKIIHNEIYKKEILAKKNNIKSLIYSGKKF